MHSVSFQNHVDTVRSTRLPSLPLSLCISSVGIYIARFGEGSGLGPARGGYAGSVDLHTDTAALHSTKGQRSAPCRLDHIIVKSHGREHQGRADIAEGRSQRAGLNLDGRQSAIVCLRGRQDLSGVQVCALYLRRLAIVVRESAFRANGPMPDTARWTQP
jgi:hypothetical protein